MSRWKLAVLVAEMLLFTIILVLPQVELPEFTIHGDTAPVATKVSLSSPPMPVKSAFAAKVPVWFEVTDQFLEMPVLYSAAHAGTPLSLSCALLC